MIKSVATKLSKRGFSATTRNLSSTAAASDSVDRAREYIDLESKHGANNYAPLPVVLAKGQGVSLDDYEVSNANDSFSSLFLSLTCILHLSEYHF